MKRLKIVVFALVICMTLGACFPPTPTPAPTSTPVLTSSAEFVTAAWDAYNRNDFPKAIELAQECINRWESEAVKQQAALTQPPPNGQVTAEERSQVFVNWALNDVGTAYFIQALSYEKSGKPSNAKEAYNAVLTFPGARCWDPQGWFWSPAEAARDNLAKLP